MKKYVSAGPEVEIAGYGIQAYELAYSKQDFAHILEAYGLTEIDADGWYPQQLTLDIQKAIKESENGGEQLIDVGIAVIEASPFPPFESLDDAFAGFSMHYGMNFRNHPPSEGIFAHKLSENHFQIVNATPHSDEMVYGYVYALVKRFVPMARQPRVTFDPSTPVDSDKDMIINVELR
jgi:hypothetical protein